VRLHPSIPLVRIVPDDTKFDFMQFRRISFPASALLSILAICLFFFHGLNFGIDFIGGTLIEVQSKTGAADLGKMRNTLGGLGLGEVQLQQFGGPENVLIRVAQQPGGEEAQQAALAKVRQALGNEVDIRREEVVGPRVSKELLAYSTIGLMLAIFAILIYLWFRFEWQFALGAMIANVHDLVLTIGYMSLTQIDFDLSSIAALLTILGYSLNDTVVIYDRIREMLRRYKRISMPELLNISVNSTLSRSIITHVTVTLALLALLFFGGHAIHSFVATMIFGVVLVGTYTSVFIAAPVIALMFVLGTSTVVAYVPNNDIDLIGPVAQVLRFGYGPFGIATPLVTMAILMTLAMRVGQASVAFTAVTRLPMVAGWDHMLPAWFSRLHATYKTPVNSIMMVGAASFGIASLSLIGVGHAEAFQLLFNASGIFYALTYVVMFAIPLFGLRSVALRPPMWLRLASLSGLLMTVLYIVLSVFPIIKVESVSTFALKITMMIVAMNMVGIGILLSAGQRSASAAAKARSWVS